jgi:hypothetical protein
VLQARLQQAGLESAEAQTLTDRIARKADEFMQPTLAQVGDGVKRLVEWYRVGGREVLEKYLSIDDYLAQQIQTRPLEKVFAENFTFRDIYVPLEVQFIQTDGEVQTGARNPLGSSRGQRTLLNDDRENEIASCSFRGDPDGGKVCFAACLRIGCGSTSIPAGHRF